MARAKVSFEQKAEWMREVSEPKAPSATLGVRLRIGTDKERIVSFLEQLIAQAKAAQAGRLQKVG